MYKKWRIEDIEAEINRIGVHLNYPCNLKIEVSNRATKRLGAFFYKKNKYRIEPVKFVFASILLNGEYPEDVVREVIIHEYLHYYCDTKSGQSNGHNRFFKEMCIKCGISPRATIDCNSLNNIRNSYSNEVTYKIYCINCGKIVCIHKRRDAADRKVKNYISRCCNSRLKSIKSYDK